MEISFEAWEGVQRHGQDLGDRLVQASRADAAQVGALRKSTSPPSPSTPDVEPQEGVPLPHGGGLLGHRYRQEARPGRRLASSDILEGE
jgi:hypothetical protein